jgi:hypothetical protein
MARWCRKPPRQANEDNTEELSEVFLP